MPSMYGTASAPPRWTRRFSVIASRRFVSFFTFGHATDLGADIATVQRLAGHKSPSTTSKYDRRGEVAKQGAAALLHVPYVGTAGGAELL